LWHIVASTIPLAEFAGLMKGELFMSLTELIAKCDEDLHWLASKELNGLPWVFLTLSGDTGARPRIRQRLMSLLRAAMETACEPPPITAEDILQATRTEKMTKALGLIAAMGLVKRLRSWAGALNTPAANRSSEQVPESNVQSVPETSVGWISLADAELISGINRGTISKAIDGAGLPRRPLGRAKQPLAGR
jgi:hypothetical protein